MPENWDAVRTFAACAGQWRRGPQAEPLALDYAGAKAAAEGLGIQWREVFRAVALMEAEALRLLAVSGG